MAPCALRSDVRRRKGLWGAILLLTAVVCLTALHARGVPRRQVKLAIDRFKKSAKELEERFGGASAAAGSRSLRTLEQQESDLEQSNKLERHIHDLLSSNEKLASSAHKTHQAAHLGLENLGTKSRIKQAQLERQIRHLLRINTNLAQQNTRLVPSVQKHSLHRQLMKDDTSKKERSGKTSATKTSKSQYEVHS